jgi:dihydrolipoamide dehydrogenase
MARVVADNITGTERTARYEGIPRVVFADPEVAAVGLTTEQAEQQGLSIASAEVDLSNAIARPWTYENNPRGHLGVLADKERRVLVGAWAVGSTPPRWPCASSSRSSGCATRSHSSPPTTKAGSTRSRS